MISNKKFANFMIEVEKRFSALECKIEGLKSELSMQELKHKLEIQSLKGELEQKKFIADLETMKQKPETDEEKLLREEEQKTANLMQLYTEDPETLRRLGFRIPSGGNVNAD